MLSDSPSALFWFRRDLRLEDNAGLYAALERYETVYCVFVFDREILDALSDREDRRVEFIWQSVQALRAQLQALGGDLLVYHGVARDILVPVAKALSVSAVYANEDYEPDAAIRDQKVAERLRGLNIAFHPYKDQVIFAKDEVLTSQGKPFTVFTPYKNAWYKRLDSDPSHLMAYSIERYSQRLKTNGRYLSLLSITRLKPPALAGQL